MRKLFALVFLLLLASNGFSGASQAGAIFLIIFPGARPNGMGAAFCSIADDAMSTYYNPAGAAFQESTNVSLMHANWLTGLYPDMYYEYIGVVKPVEEIGNFGANFIYLTTGETEGTDPYGNTIGRWRTFDFSFGLIYSTKLQEKLGIGAGIKFIYSYLAPDWIVKQVIPGTKGGGQGYSFAVDLATLYKLNERISLGVVLQNLGPDIRYVSGGERDPLPRTLRVGLSYRLLNTKMNKLTVAAEITKILVALTRDLNYEFNEAWKHFGAEYWFYDFFAARTGYFIDREGERKGPTFGGGIKFKKFSFDIGVDSALYDFDTSNYRFSLGYIF